VVAVDDRVAHAVGRRSHAARRPAGRRSHSAAYGHTIGAALGLGYVKRTDGAAIDTAWLESGRFEVDLAGTRLKAKVSLRRPYDPAGARIKV
jgi:sarcosine dehydrogenase